jgi:transcriptional regulator with XRE-family HTH domain
MKETIGEYIHQLRIENNLTLTKLAAALDIDQSTLSKIENHKRNIPEEILPKLASLFKLDYSELKKEFLSEKIAELIIKQENAKEVLELANEKANYYKEKNITQGQINFKQ